MVRVFSITFTGTLVSLVTATASPRAAIRLPRQDGTTTTLPTFANITASPELKWTNCYGPNIQCSLLTVPLDYENIEAGTADIAFARYLISEDAEDLLFNPGGPGVSGTEQVISSGESYATKWNYNFVSFDPRGVKFSGPKVSCSSSGESTNATLSRRQQGGSGLEEIYNQKLQENKACSAANENTDAKYVGTLAVVQDMYYFTQLQAGLRGEDPEQIHINYYGVSYGTLVGETLVATYPDRIRRVLLDANVYGVAHYQGYEPSTLDDFATGIWLFNKLCYEAGEEWCVLATGASSIDEVQARFDAVVDRLRIEPITHGNVTYDDSAFLSAVFNSLYFPVTQSPEFGNYSQVASTTWALLNNDTSVFNGPAPVPITMKADNILDDGDMLAIITAVDAAGRYPWNTYEEFEDAFSRLAATAPYGAKGFMEGNGIIGLAMDAFIPPPSQLFTGFARINTSAPVLFVNTEGDPVTPRSSAYQMSALFSNSAVLIQKGPGHGYSNSPSKCTESIIAAYFADGTIPKPGTVCEVDVEASYYFGGPSAATSKK